MGQSIDTANQVTIVELIKTGAAINRGNRGGPLANQLGMPVSDGVVVLEVSAGSAAHRASIRDEDAIVQMGGETISNTGEFPKFLIAHPPGATITAVDFRNGNEMMVQATLGERPKT